MDNQQIERGEYLTFNVTTGELSITPAGIQYVSDEGSDAREYSLMNDLFEDIAANSELEWCSDLTWLGHMSSEEAVVITHWGDDMDEPYAETVWHNNSSAIRPVLVDLLVHGTVQLTYWNAY